MAPADTMKPTRDAVARVDVTEWGAQGNGVGKYDGGLTSHILTAEEYSFISSFFEEMERLEKDDLSEQTYRRTRERLKRRGRRRSDRSEVEVGPGGDTLL
jgi:hypothetical protein